MSRRFPFLSAFGHEITAVFNVNRTRLTADVWLDGLGVERVQLAKVVGAPGTTWPADEIRELLERRTRLVFGTLPGAKTATEPAKVEPEAVEAFEVGYRAGEHI